MERAGHGSRAGGGYLGAGRGNRGRERGEDLNRYDDDEDEEDESFHTSDAEFIDDDELDDNDLHTPMLLGDFDDDEEEYF
mmetsp:Transcript_19355/g.16570  ORF Transcript_19355/g.16570 Transcript_19355/m.16570 type:complete len:80 (-) Transcript_19355:27-266(-)|eukprot:CAMPEP_0114593528 /NCGR_PEP_ID=MMETSP0125-20121206/15126_1 /TAXON_ID=485358 ORGANISM="Aristerostoma sp., Strain ATCC 50986" /NCGR_SAMPLE_ID=MMETSP0125 /ASSEMBLY_ACC=CAM_ASM_000245 /LENGTH=79 /DNA_ID=CAMNT_0001792805 /DNA_START=1075 /DNA_END=1314 /DNA_ORIENTATION=+